MPIYSNFYQTLTTACPIVELRGYAAACGLKGHLYAYLDFNGPTGTARDGLAEGMLALAIEKKQLAPGQPIIEAASGPFATALTLASLTAGHPIVLVMPEDAPALRQEYLLRLGAQILIGSWTPLDTEAPALPDAEPPPQAVRAADAASRPCNAFATQRKPRRPAAFAAYRRDLYRIAKYRSAQAGPHCPPTMLPPRKGPVFPEAACFKRTFRTSCLCPA